MKSVSGDAVSRWRLWLSLLALVALIAGCPDRPATQIVVHVDSDTSLAGQIQRVDVRAYFEGSPGRPVIGDAGYDLVGRSYALPGDVSIVPSDLDESRKLFLEVTARTSFGELTQRAALRFNRGHQVWWFVQFTRGCVGVVCASGQSCGNEGRCRLDTQVPVSEERPMGVPSDGAVTPNDLASEAALDVASDVVVPVDADDAQTLTDAPDVPAPMDVPDVPAPMDVPDVPAPMDVPDVPAPMDAADGPAPMDAADGPTDIIAPDVIEERADDVPGEPSSDAPAPDATCSMNNAVCDGTTFDLNSSSLHCGVCFRRCSGTSSSVATYGCVCGSCAITACAAGLRDCDRDVGNGCEANVLDDPSRCGSCGNVCNEAEYCLAGVCTRLPAALNCAGAMGALDPGPAPVGDAGVDGGDGGSPQRVITLSPGVHAYTSVRIPRDVVLRLSSGGVLDLRSCGDVLIEGVIDLSGGNGGNGTSIFGASSMCTDGVFLNGGGGSTATGQDGRDGTTTSCNGAGSGGGEMAMVGGSTAGAMAGCGAGGNFGGGAGGRYNMVDRGVGGGGGGGYAGGGGGAGAQGIRLPSVSGGAGGSSGGTGGAGGTAASGGGCIGRGGDALALIGDRARYAGTNGVSAQCGDGWGGSAGGGSIGLAAASDLMVGEMTFRPGSGGGGGGGGNGNHNCPGPMWGSGGGGGGGGALRIASRTTVTLAAGARLLANGGNGGRATGDVRPAGGSGGPPFTYYAAGAGGGGSGGVIYVAAPTLDLRGELSVRGGVGAANLPSVSGGNGGLGRIRLSVDPGRCALNASSWTVPLPRADGSTCGLSSTTSPAPAEVYVGSYPD